MKVHTQEEVAKILRKSPVTIYRLRMDGLLAYIPGRPVTITDAALQDYIARAAAKTTMVAQEGQGQTVLSAEAERDALLAGRLLARSRRGDLSLEDQGRLLAKRARLRTARETKAADTD